jgi:hypothetical protein
MFQAYLHLHYILWQLSIAAILTAFLYAFVFLKKLKLRHKFYCIFSSIFLISLHFIFNNKASLTYFILYVFFIWTVFTIAARLTLLFLYVKRKLFKGRYRSSNPYQSSNGMKTSFGLKMRSKSELLIAEKLYEKKIKFEYERPLSADGKTFYPDFTIYLKNKTIYWEHFGMLSDKEYHKRFKIKLKWYEKNFPNKLVWTKEEIELLPEIAKIIERLK